ncbi:sulfatase-like hydrolase/transferase [Akkermansiaceae bacterium]|nr:sulfatase-like hydrolase/transferase [Akkermansiaceae bacterium]
MLKLSSLALLLALLLPATAERTPNFVVIYTDDQGYGDLGCFGGKHVSTPRIDQMASEGMRLTSFYMAAPLVFLGRGKGKEATPITRIPKEAAQRTENHFAGAVEAHKIYNDYELATKLTEKAVDWIEEIP